MITELELLKRTSDFSRELGYSMAANTGKITDIPGLGLQLHISRDASHTHTQQAHSMQNLRFGSRAQAIAPKPYDMLFKKV